MAPKEARTPAISQFSSLPARGVASVANFAAASKPRMRCVMIASWDSPRPIWPSHSGHAWELPQVRAPALGTPFILADKPGSSGSICVKSGRRSRCSQWRYHRCRSVCRCVLHRNRTGPACGHCSEPELAPDFTHFENNGAIIGSLKRPGNGVGLVDPDAQS